MVQTFTTGRMALGAGDTVDLLPSDWADIETAKATAVVHHRDGSTATVTLSNGGKGEVLDLREGVPATRTVARFAHLSPAGLSTLINWGDGTTSVGTLQETSAGKFEVRGSHPWATTGTKSVVVTVTEHASASGQGQTIKIASNKNFSGTVAQLQLPIPGSAPGDYITTIDWGDHTISTGKLTLQPDGTVILTGSHTYATGKK
jgi:hypothetical protein